SGRLDGLGRTALPVSIERVKALAPGFHEQTAATTVTPPNVRIDGPKSQLTGIQAVVLVEMDAYNSPGFNQPFSVVLWDQNKKPVSKSMTATHTTVTLKIVITAAAYSVDEAVWFT